MKRFALHAGGRTRKPKVSWVRDGCDQLFFLFQGQRPDLTQDKPTFVRKTGLLDRNFVFFRDESRRRYQHGISDEIPSIPALVRWQQQYRESQPHVRRTFSLGTSYGGYAALLFGHALSVEVVWAFAPVTFLVGVRSGFGDLSRVLANPNGTTEYRVFYNERNVADRNAALRIRDCHGVKLFPRAGTAHDVVADLEASGDLETLLPPFLQ